jgi:hypothetical protein
LFYQKQAIGKLIVAEEWERREESIEKLGILLKREDDLTIVKAGML